MVTYNYNKDKEILETFFVNNVTQGEIINFLKAIRSTNEMPKDLRMLIDSTKGSLALNPAQLYKILDENIKLFSRFNTLKVAIVLDRPVDTALAVIYTRLIQLERYQFQVFNTILAATGWINKGVNGGNRHIKPNTPPLLNNII
ncbi:hypothetical protein E9993_18890 [Labilibacter sediminis]|nr:hypothetical protein E9993_18890 [Labilibacter sediminis]